MNYRDFVREAVRQHGKGHQFVAVVPLKLERSGNTREHWRKTHKRTQEHKMLTTSCLRLQIAPGRFMSLPVQVTMIRLGPRRMDSDNVVSTFKDVQDAVADWLGVGDGDLRVDWVYKQARSTQYGVVILVKPKAEGGYGALFRQARKAAKVTLAAAARHLDVSTSFLSDVELGRRPPMANDRTCLAAELFGVKPETLVEAAAVRRGEYVLPASVSDKGLKAGAALACGWERFDDKTFDEILDVILTTKQCGGKHG